METNRETITRADAEAKRLGAKYGIAWQKLRYGVTDPYEAKAISQALAGLYDTEPVPYRKKPVTDLTEMLVIAQALADRRNGVRNAH